jgi:hypothetical protein
LQLWDRIIGFDSLNVLPVVAAALFSFRRTALLKVWCSFFKLTSAPPFYKQKIHSQAQTTREIEHIMADNFAVCVIPLLQHCLFA